jgi:hypothetical protein
LGVLTILAGLSVPAAALADVRVVHGQFTDRVENGRPVGDATTLATARTATYWLEFQNTGDPTTVTLVWRLDGHEARRQSLNVGRGSRWRTWGTHRIRGAHQVEVQVLDAAGTQIHTESTTLAAH